eukprot:TRINITY_DN5442_c0_g1_i1.p1 TRINITY_DN5442_c0_g1~~TRINITY_DN5442_c0_g1_i1.p1  ORF type:complete len:303 (+),score=49.17 TRINITY_DN5442_c0_g1_i1:242-1150(+)
MGGIEWNSLVPWVLFLFTLSYVTFIYEIMLKWLGMFGTYGLAHSIYLHMIMGMMYYTYFKALYVGPGFVPLHWQPEDVNEADLDIIKRGSKLVGPNGNELSKEEIFIFRRQSDLLQIKYCKFCKSFKPLRSHHCKDCKKCILRMDHHCPWINNCVGYQNHRYFMQFLFYLMLSSSYLLLVFIARLVVGSNEGASAELALNLFDFIFLILQLFILLPTLFGVSFLFFYQLSLILKNCTGIEWFTIERERKYAKRNSIPYSDPFNLGTRKNLEDLFGSNLWMFFLPSDQESDGLKYETNEQSMV